MTKQLVTPYINVKDVHLPLSSTPEEIDAAIRSRCAEVYFEPLSESQIREIVSGAARRLGAKLERGVPKLIASYTIEGRKAVQILADAFGHALERRSASKSKTKPEKVPQATIGEGDVAEVVQSGRLIQHTLVRARRGREVGKVFGIGVSHHVGSLIEIEAVAFPTAEKRKGTIRFNDTAGSMAKDSVFNASSVVRAVAGLDPERPLADCRGELVRCERHGVGGPNAQAVQPGAGQDDRVVVADLLRERLGLVGLSLCVLLVDLVPVLRRVAEGFLEVVRAPRVRVPDDRARLIVLGVHSHAEGMAMARHDLPREMQVVVALARLAIGGGIHLVEALGHHQLLNALCNRKVPICLSSRVQLNPYCRLAYMESEARRVVQNIISWIEANQPNPASPSPSVEDESDWARRRG